MDGRDTTLIVFLAADGTTLPLIQQDGKPRLDFFERTEINPTCYPTLNVRKLISIRRRFFTTADINSTAYIFNLQLTKKSSGRVFEMEI